MNGCPLGFAMEEVLGRMKCRACSHQCMLSFLAQEVRKLKEELAELKKNHGPF